MRSNEGNTVRKHYLLGTSKALLVFRPYLSDGCQQNEETSSDHGLLVDNIEFLGNSRGKKTSSKDGGTSFSNEVGRGRKVIDDFRGTLSGRWRVTWGCQSSSNHRAE